MKILIWFGAAAIGGAAQAHVVLDVPRAPAGSAYKAVLRVSHGCEGTPTHTVSVQIPAGLRGAKPMPKPGWTLSVRKQALAQPYDSHGRTVRCCPRRAVTRITERESRPTAKESRT